MSNSSIFSRILHAFTNFWKSLFKRDGTTNQVNHPISSGDRQKISYNEADLKNVNVPASTDNKIKRTIYSQQKVSYSEAELQNVNIPVSPIKKRKRVSYSENELFSGTHSHVKPKADQTKSKNTAHHVIKSSIKNDGGIVINGIKTTCSYCQLPIMQGESVIVCKSCNAKLHMECVNNLRVKQCPNCRSQRAHATVEGLAVKDK